MKLLKRLLFLMIGIVALVLIVAAFTKKEYAVNREISINKANQQVFEYIKYLKNQDNYSKWATMDSKMKKTFSGTDGTVGFVSAWEGDKKTVGTGEQEIKKITEGKRIDMELRFKVPFEAKDQAYMETTQVQDSVTKVVWGFNGKMPYPMNLMLLFMNFDKQLGGDLEYGLNKLKTVLEKQ